MIEGLQAIRIQVPDLALATRWYRQALEVEPYQSHDANRPGVTFFLGGSLLSLEQGPIALPALPQAHRAHGPTTTAADTASDAPDTATAASTTAYWRVDNLQAELARLLDLQAAPWQSPRQLDAQTRIAAVLDPFGNVLGLLERHDPAIPQARVQRVAEKVALRNVRETLDTLADQHARTRPALKAITAFVAAGALLAAILIWDMLRR